MGGMGMGGMGMGGMGMGWHPRMQGQRFDGEPWGHTSPNPYYQDRQQYNRNWGPGSGGYDGQGQYDGDWSGNSGGSGYDGSGYGTDDYSNQ